MKRKYYDIGIIGAGASGCAAAVSAKMNNCGISVAVLEKNDIIMKKVIASGNGRCNILNSACDIEETIDFFNRIGIFVATEEEGRMYPRTGYSKTVSSRFEKALDKYGIDVFCGCTVKDIKGNDSFTVETTDGEFEFSKLLIASGGKAGPQFGTIGDSYSFLRKLGHTISTLRPSLTAVICEGEFETLKGIRAKAKVWLLKNGEVEAGPETGEVQFTKDGLSGICIMNLSKYIILDKSISREEAYREYEIKADFAYDLHKDALDEMTKCHGRDEVYEGLLREPLAERIDYIKDARFKITGTKGWKEAQVTAGGLLMSEISSDTMESLLVKNLFVSGEALDYDGPCGGFNLANAWKTGIKAGKAMSNVED